MHIREIIFCLCLYLTYPLAGIAQAIWPADFPFARQLPSNEMTCLHQDADGFIWTGTTGGLARYDGYHLQIFQSDYQSPSRLTHNHITCITEDSLHLWVGTDKGLNLIDKQTYQTSTPAEKVLQEKRIRALCSDGKGTVWAAVDNMLFTFRLSPNLCSTLRLPKRGKPNAQINSLTYDSRNKLLWICMEGGIYSYAPQEQRLRRLPDSGQPAIPINLFHDNAGNCWLTTWGEGLWRIIHDGKWQQVRYVHQDTGGMNGHDNRGNFFSMTQDNTFGYLWALSYDRLYAFRYDSISERLLPVPLPPHLDTNKMYTQLLKDRDGNLWISSYDGGTLLTFHTETLHHYPLEQVGRTLGSMPNLLTLDRDSLGRFWFIQDRFGLCLYDPSTGQTVLSSPSIQKQTVDVRVTASSPSSGGLWVAAPNSSRLYLILCSHGGFQTVRTLFPSRSPGITSPAQQMQETPDGYLWTRHGERILCHPPHGATAPLTTPDSLHFVCLTTAAGKVWGATARHLFLLEREDGHIRCKRQTPAFPFPEEESARFLYADENGGFWAVTNLGRILHATHGQSEFQDVSNDFDRQNKMTLNLLGQGEYLWLIFHNQIVHYNIRHQFQRQYAPSDGNMTVSIFRDQAACLSGEGILYAGGRGGITSIAPPAADASSPRPRPVLLTDIRSGTRSLLFSPSSRLTRGTPDRHKIVLTPEATSLSVSFSTLDYTRSANVRFACRLEGIDKTWNYLSEGENTAYYQNVPKGKFRLWVKSTDADGRWQAPEQLLTLTRLPAWYETTWACLLYVLLSVLLVGLLLRLYLSRLHSQNQLKLQEALTQAKLDYFTNISHDLLTPLSVISCVGNYWEQTYPAEQHHTRILLHNISRLKRLLKQALDFRKVETGSLELRPEGGDIFAFAHRLCTDFFQPLADQKGVQLRIHIPEGECPGTLDFDKADKILYNLLSNAVKYTPAGKNIDFTVAIQSGQEGRHAIFTVQDEGPGIPHKEQLKVFERFYTGSNARTGQSNGIGLDLSRELAELHHGHLTLESEPGKGACFTLSLPIDLPAATPSQAGSGYGLPADGDRPVADAVPDNPKESGTDQADHRPTVLIVDDNTQLLELMAQILRQNYHPVTATQGEEALTLLAQYDVDVVVSDVMMPGMDGFTLCRRIKSDIETSHIPVIMLTAKQSPDDRVACYDAGADGFLAKPFELKVLAARIDNLIRARRKRQETFKTEDSVQLAELDYTSADTQFLQTMTDSIHTHLAEEGFGLEQLSTDLHVSKSTLHRKVKAMTGLTPLEFIRNIKLKYACMMLSRHDSSIAEVAYATGFSSPKYFTRCFKEEFGLTPSEYQQQHPDGT